jgi:hypothetical protein
MSQFQNPPPPPKKKEEIFPKWVLEYSAMGNFWGREKGEIVIKHLIHKYVTRKTISFHHLDYGYFFFYIFKPSVCHNPASSLCRFHSKTQHSLLNSSIPNSKLCFIQGGQGTKNYIIFSHIFSLGNVYLKGAENTCWDLASIRLGKLPGKRSQIFYLFYNFIFPLI